MSDCHSHDHVSCQRAYDLLFDYLEGSLPETESAAVREHFKLCPPCLEFLESYRKTPGLCRTALERETPPQVTEKLLDFLRKKLPSR
jgi:hypothetical protein